MVIRTVGLDLAKNVFQVHAIGDTGEVIVRRSLRLNAADPRINALLARKPVRLVTVAMANRAARVIWAIMVRGEVYRRPVARMAP